LDPHEATQGELQGELDDAKIYMRVSRDADIAKLQCALDALTDWEDVWQLTVSVKKCSIVSIGKIEVQLDSLHIADYHLPVHSYSIDLGITVTDDLKPCAHITAIVAKAHQRANAILRSFISRDLNSLVCGFLVYVCPLLKHNSTVWSPFYQQDIDTIERVQRKFTKRLPGLSNYSYAERLKLLGLHSLKRRRVYIDLTWCYKIVFGLVDLDCNEFFHFCDSQTREHAYKLCKNFSRTNIHVSFFSQHIISVWNSLPSHVDFCSLSLFKRSLGSINFEDILIGS